MCNSQNIVIIKVFAKGCIDINVYGKSTWLYEEKITFDESNEDVLPTPPLFLMSICLFCSLPFEGKCRWEVFIQVFSYLLWLQHRWPHWSLRGSILSWVTNCLSIYSSNLFGSTDILPTTNTSCCKARQIRGTIGCGILCFSNAICIRDQKKSCSIKYRLVGFRVTY